MLARAAALLARALGGAVGEDMSHVAFAPGSAELGAKAREQLDKVAKALTDRPQLKLTVVGTARLEAERDAYKRQRLQADDAFLFGIQAQCERKLSKTPDLLAQCRADAGKYYLLVRQFGVGAYDADATTPGDQAVMPASTNPDGGARNNA